MAMQINKKQIKILETIAYNKYIERLITHCDKKFPYLKKYLGKDRLKQILIQSVEKAQESGFYQEDTTRFYIDMMITFGFGFEKDPQYSWVREVNLNYKNFEELTQLQMLYLEAAKYLEKYYDKEESLRKIFIQNLIDHLSNTNHQKVSPKQNEVDEIGLLLGEVSPLTLSNLPRFNPIKDVYTTEKLINNISNQLAKVAPQKYQATTDKELSALIESGIKKAKETYKFYRQHQIISIILLMFLFGSDFDSDPFIANNLIEPYDTKNNFTHSDSNLSLNEHFPWLEYFLNLINKE